MSPRDEQPLYKILSVEAWVEARASGLLPPAEVDRRDGFIHLSAVDQVEETARKHFAGRDDLMLVAIDAARIDPDALRWEVSRGGARFPHVYGEISLDAVIEARRMPEVDATFSLADLA